MSFSPFALLELLLPVSVHDFAVRAVLLFGCAAVFFDPLREAFPALPPLAAVAVALGFGCISIAAYGIALAFLADRLPPLSPPPCDGVSSEASGSSDGTRR